METNSGVVALSANCSEKEVSTCINSQKEILWLAGLGPSPRRQSFEPQMTMRDVVYMHVE